MLPGFCNFPTDFSESFKHLAKTLGETLEKCPDLRYSIMHALRLLIKRNTGLSIFSEKNTLIKLV
jgi:hypothetical protein